MPKRKNARLNGDTSDTMNFAAMGVNEDEKIRIKNIMIFFICKHT